jgi:hypothetical protein
MKSSLKNSHPQYLTRRALDVCDVQEGEGGAAIVLTAITLPQDIASVCATRVTMFSEEVDWKL